MADKVEVFYGIRDDEIPYLIVIGNNVTDFFSNDLVIQRVQFDVIPFPFERSIDGIIIGNALPEALNRFLFREMIEFGNIDLHKNTCIQNFLIIVH